MIGGNLGAEITGDLFRGSHIPSDHFQHRFVQYARIVEFQRRYEQPLFEHLPVVR